MCVYQSLELRSIISLYTNKIQLNCCREWPNGSNFIGSYNSVEEGVFIQLDPSHYTGDHLPTSRRVTSIVSGFEPTRILHPCVIYYNKKRIVLIKRENRLNKKSIVLIKRESFLVWRHTLWHFTCWLKTEWQNDMWRHNSLCRFIYFIF